MLPHESHLLRYHRMIMGTSPILNLPPHGRGLPSAAAPHPLRLQQNTLCNMNATEQMTLMIRERKWDSLLASLDKLSNMQFRKMEGTLREKVLPQLDNSLFWEALLHLIIYKRQAFISGVLAAKHLADDGTLDFSIPHVQELTAFLYQTKPEAILKLCNMLLPLLKTEEQVTSMFRSLHVERTDTKLAALLRVNSPLSYYAIFKTLKTCDERGLILRCCHALTKRQEDMAYNAACIIKAYFGLDELPGHFSLKIEQYELSHLDRNYDTFMRMLYGKRPKI